MRVKTPPIGLGLLGILEIAAMEIAGLIAGLKEVTMLVSVYTCSRRGP